MDFLKKAQNKIEAAQKKVETIVGQIEKAPILTFSQLSKHNVKKEKPKKTTTKDKKENQDHSEVKNRTKKPDLSIEGISKQILSQRDSFIRNGFKKYEFIANSDCCPTCAALNGKHFPVSKLKIGVNAPPMHEGCRCSIAAYEDEAEYEKWLNSL